MPDTIETAPDALLSEAEGLLAFYRERCGGDGEVMGRMAYDFAAALADLDRAEQRAKALADRMSSLASFGFARCGIAGSVKNDYPAPAEPLMP